MSHAEYEEIGRSRARAERAVMKTAIENMNRILSINSVDITPYLEKAKLIHRTLPTRYRYEFQGVVDGLSVPEETMLLYVFTLSNIVSDLAGTNGGEECSNIIVSRDRTAVAGPLVLKNRDITARSLRPQTVVEYPSLAGYHGFLTITSCGTPFVFQGVNRNGLVAANTFVDIKNDQVPTEKRIRNGVVVRHILEECATVTEALAYVRRQTRRNMKGFTLALADANRSVVVEMDPIKESIRLFEADIVVRTNHFPADAEVMDSSSSQRFGRLQQITNELPDSISRVDLAVAAMDHANGPGPDSICRHQEPGSDELAMLGQSTTVTSAVYEGGAPRVHTTIGYPCQRTSVTYSLQDEGAQANSVVPLGGQASEDHSIDN